MSAGAGAADGATDTRGARVALQHHLIDAHRFTSDYFDDDAGPWTLGQLRWLHAPWLKTREYPDGCQGI